MASAAAVRRTQDRVVGFDAGLGRALAGVFDGAQGGGQLLAQLVAAQVGAGVGEVGDGLFRRAQHGAFAGQFGLLVLARIESVEVGEVQRDLLGAGGRVGGGGAQGSAAWPRRP